MQKNRVPDSSSRQPGAVPIGGPLPHVRAYVLDPPTAAFYDPLYDVHAQTWRDAGVAEIAGHIPLPRLAWPGEVVGEVTPEAARATGLRAGTPVTAGTIDVLSEALSVGAEGASLSSVMRTTSTVVDPQPRRRPAAWNAGGPRLRTRRPRHRRPPPLVPETEVSVAVVVRKDRGVVASADRDEERQAEIEPSRVGVSESGKEQARRALLLDRFG